MKSRLSRARAHARTRLDVFALDGGVAVHLRGVAGKQLITDLRIAAGMVLSGEMEDGEEGCLSIPDVFAHVKRYSLVELKGYDLNQNEIRIEADGFLSRAIQHEMEHLNGSLFWDNLGVAKRDILKRKFKKKLRDK